MSGRQTDVCLEQKEEYGEAGALVLNSFVISTVQAAWTLCVKPVNI